MSAPKIAVEVDIAIVGGGLVGASLAIALQPCGLRMALIESVSAEATGQPSFDDRTTALGNSSRRIFEALDVWPLISGQAAPIKNIHVSDAGRFGFARLSAAEQGIDSFGYVVTNRVLGQALRTRLGALKDIDLRMPSSCTHIAISESQVEIHTEPSALPIRAKLVIAADGSRSQVRSAAGLSAEVEDYQQVAVIAHVAATRSSDGTAYERFTSEGPFAVLPLHNGCYGVVWTLPPSAAELLMAASDAEYLAQLQRQFGWRIGRFLRVGQRSAYPLQLTRATKTIGPRVALIGNAAQALHPVAGQGFNLGLRDAATLAEVLSVLPAGADVGASAVLADFSARRMIDRDGITRFTDGLVKLFSEQRLGVPLLRDMGLLMFDLSPTAKQALSKLSWGFARHTPRLARGLNLIL